MRKKRIALLGSTGSIGTQTLEVIESHPEHFEVEALTAHNNAELLIRQSMQHVPNVVVIGNEAHFEQVREALGHLPIKVYCGEEAIAQVACFDSVDLVLTAMVGFSGLKPTMEAIRVGKDIALANKETMVVAGQLVMEEAARMGSMIIPVDSEHSAIFQCLVGESSGDVEKLILTASGGPFRGKDTRFLKEVTPGQALSHPNWCMGPKITIDSATLMNKGLEVIEARWLFGVPSKNIEVVVHPQSIIHSMVQFRDGSMKAQMGLPDMRLPIQYALGYPGRLESGFPRFSFADFSQLTFEPADTKIFRNLALSFEALNRGGNWPCILNAANEVAVEAFLGNRIRFLDIPDIIEGCLTRVAHVKRPGLDDLFETDRESREVANELIGK
jgi:1-deoxy-D-xylulose-5-phosphate reductoisomerase